MCDISSIFFFGYKSEHFSMKAKFLKGSLGGMSAVDDNDDACTCICILWSIGSYM